jgi:hypothetical protein
MTEPDEQSEQVEQDISTVPEPDQDEEAAEAEAQPETSEDGADEPGEAPEAQGTTPEEWEERHKKAEKEFRRYTNAIGRIYEEDANAYLPCPLCADMPAGFVHPASVGTYPEDVTGAVMMLLGQTASDEVKDDPYSTLCETCVGFGVVRTGSRVPNHELRTCGDCKGLGYLPLTVGGPEPAASNGHSEQNERGVRIPAQTSPESPEIEALRLRGFTIIPPMTPTA